MVSIARRTATLAFARLTNQALAFLGPVFMVRLLTVEQYGHYRDFLLYGALLLPWIQLSINSSLAYFIPREPENERLYLSQASFLVLCSSTVVCGLVLLFGGYLPSATVRSFVGPLSLYVFLFANLDAWEFYWLAKKKPLNVLYYSASRLGLRTALVVGAAYLSRRVETVVWTLVAFEALRFVSLACYGAAKRLFTTRIDRAAIGRQFGFFMPLGVNGVLFNLNNYMGQFFVSTWLGPATLAVFTVGTWLQPIVQIFRNSIADVIMPEIVARRDAPANVALGLWQRATVVYCAVMLPLAAMLFYYADVVVETLFTTAYSAATPVFRIYVLLLVRECLDFGLPLRVVNRTRIFISVGVLSLIVNLTAMVALFDRLGMLAPAVAIIGTRFFAAVYLGRFVAKYCNFSVSNMLPWVDMGKVLLTCLVCVPVLLAGDLLAMNSLLRAILFGVIYTLVYFAALRLAGIPEITEAVARLRRRLAGPAAGR